MVGKDASRQAGAAGSLKALPGRGPQPAWFRGAAPGRHPLLQHGEPLRARMHVCGGKAAVLWGTGHLDHQRGGWTGTSSSRRRHGPCVQARKLRSPVAANGADARPAGGQVVPLASPAWGPTAYISQAAPREGARPGPAAAPAWPAVLGAGRARPPLETAAAVAAAPPLSCGWCGPCERRGEMASGVPAQVRLRRRRASRGGGEGSSEHVWSAFLPGPLLLACMPGRHLRV